MMVANSYTREMYEVDVRTVTKVIHYAKLRADPTRFCPYWSRRFTTIYDLLMAGV